jgi:hypothetical protein
VIYTVYFGYNYESSNIENVYTLAHHKRLPAVTEAARDAAKQLASWGAVEAMAKKAMTETEVCANSADFAEFLLSGEGSRAIIRIGGTVCRIES